MNEQTVVEMTQHEVEELVKEIPGYSEWSFIDSESSANGLSHRYNLEAVKLSEDELDKIRSHSKIHVAGTLMKLLCASGKIRPAIYYVTVIE